MQQGPQQLEDDDPYSAIPMAGQDDDPYAAIPIVESAQRVRPKKKSPWWAPEDKRAHSGMDDPDTPAAATRRVQRMAARNAAEARGRAQGEATYATREQDPGAARMIARGVKQALGSSLQMVGQAVDLAGAEGVGEKWIERGAAIAAANPTPVESLEEARRQGGDLGDYGKWLAGAAGKAVGYIGPTMGAGLIGGLPGAAIASMAMGVGETRGEMDEIGNAQKDRDLVALGAGLTIGALDVITPGRLAGRLRRMVKTPSAVTHAVVKEAAAKGLRGAAKPLGRIGKGMVIEGGTETVQEALSYLPARAGTDVPIVWSELRSRMIEAGAQGALGGGLFTGATEVTQSVVEGRRAYQDRKVEAEMQAEAAAATGNVAPPAPPAPPPAAPEPEVQRPTESETGPAGLQPSPRVFRMPTEEVGMDPERFQFKKATRSRIEKWNPEMADLLTVWRDPADGQTYVVNGHRRLEAAKRLGVPEVDVQFIEAKTAEEARSYGAIINLSQGQGTPVDFAKYLRDSGLTQQDLEEKGVLVSDATAKKGIALSRLAPDLFDQVATGKMREEHGVAIGTELADADLQRQVVGILKGAKRMSADEVQEVARQVRVEATESVTQVVLFGEEEDRVSLVVPKARLVAQLRERLTSDKRLFGFVSKEGRAEALSTAVDTSIDVAAAQQRAQESAAIAEVFDRLYSKSGPVATLLTDSARRIARGESPRTIAGEIYEAVRTALIAERDAATVTRGAVEAGGAEGAAASDAGAVPADRGPEAQQAAGLIEEQGETEPLTSPARKGQPDLFARTKSDQGEMFGGEEVGQTRDTPQEAGGTRPELPGALTPEEIQARLARGESLQADEYATETRNVEGQGQLLSPARDSMGYPEGAHQSPINRADHWGAMVRKVFQQKAGDIRKALTERNIARKLEKGVIGAVPGGATVVYEGSRRMGGLGKVAAGFFEPLSEAIRLHRYWISTTSHELGHYISKTYFGWVTRSPQTRAQLARVFSPPATWVQAAIDELNKLGVALYYGNKKPAGGYGEEGVAEAFKWFVIDPEHLKAEAPTFYKIMEETFKRDPAFAAPWLEAQNEYARFKASPSEEQVRNKIAVDPEKFAVADGDTMANLIVEDDWFFRKAIRKLTELGVKFTAATNPYLLLRLAKGVGARAENILRKGWATFEDDPATGKTKLVRITRALKDAVNLVVKGELGHLRNYLVGMSTLDRYAFAMHKLWAKKNLDPAAPPKYFTHQDVLNLDQQDRASLEYNYKNIVGGSGYGDVGFTIKQAEDVTAEVPANIREAAEIIWENENQAIKARVNAGMMSPESGDLVLIHHPHHVSFERVDEIDPSTGRKHPVASMVGSGVMRQTGGQQPILDPIETTMKNVYRTQRDIAMFRVNTALVKAALAEGGGRLLTEVPTPRQHIGVKLGQMNPRQVIQALLDLGVELPKFPDGTPFDWPNLKKWLEAHSDIAFDLFMNVQAPRAAENEDMVFPANIDGVKRWFQVAPEQRQLYDSLMPMSDGELKTWLVIASAPARGLRIGATSTPEFGIRNTFRDLFTAAVYTRARVTIPLPNGEELFIPGIQIFPAVYRMVRGMGSLLKRDNWYDLFQFAGGDLAAMTLIDRNAQQAAIRELMAERGGFSVVRYFSRHPVEMLRLLGSASEQANRIGEFRAVYEAAIKKGFTHQEAMAKGGFAAREVTQDFAKMGQLTRIVNMLIPFAGARMGGYTKFWEEALSPVPGELRSSLLDENAPEWQRSQQAWAQIAATITIPSLMLYMMQKDDDDYKNIPRWVKAISWPIMLGNGDYIPIPKPPLIGQLFGTIPELLAEMAFSDSKRGAGTEIAKVLRDEFPFDPREAMPMKPLLENTTGQSLFFRGPLEPARTAGLVPEMRFNRHTSELLIMISQSGFGEAMRTVAGQEGVLASPAKLENLVRGYTGGVGKIGLNIADALVARPLNTLAGNAPLKPEPLDEPLASKLPAVKALYGQQPQEDALNIRYFYQRYNEADERRNTWRKKLDSGDSIGAATFFAKHRNDILMTASAEDLGGKRRNKNARGGPWREVKAEMDKMQHELRELEGINSEAATSARRQITLAMRQLTGAVLDIEIP